MKVDCNDPTVHQLYQAHLALVRGHNHTERVDLDEAGDFLIALREWAASQPGGRHMVKWADDALRTLHVPGTTEAILFWSPDVDMRYRPLVFVGVSRSRPRVKLVNSTYLEVASRHGYNYANELVIYLRNGRQEQAVVPRGASDSDVWPDVLERALKEASLCTLRDAVIRYIENVAPYGEEYYKEAYRLISVSGRHRLMELCDAADATGEQRAR